MSDSDLLKEIKDNYQYDSEQWRPIRDEGKTDMRYLLGDPWDPGDRQTRESFNRPCVSFDELHQYINQLLNSERRNRRYIQVVAQGAGSTEKTAELRENRIRRIQYESNAESAYITGLEGAVQRSYGVLCRINTAWNNDSLGKNEDGEDKDPDATLLEQKLVIRRVPNPDTVLFDWDSKEIDCSDADHLFELDYIPRAQFARKFPKATKTSFTADDEKYAPGWVREKDILVAGYWKVRQTPRTLLLIEPNESFVKRAYRKVSDTKPKAIAIYKDELDGEVPGKVMQEREVSKREIIQHVTNGIEILEENEWLGKWIPFVPCFGRELYIDEGEGSKRKLLSLVRLARDPAMTLAWIRSCMTEAVGATPKTLFRGYEGQFDTSTDWENIARSPTVYAEFKPVADPLNPGQVLPLPEPVSFDPPLQNLELFAESTRRAIQAAMGITPLPTAAQRNNEKSGIALERIDDQESEGSYHFIANYKFSLRHAGLILNDLLDKIEDTPRDVPVTGRDDKTQVVRLHDPAWVNPETKRAETLTYGASHDVTVSDGPAYDSERDEAREFADTILQNVEQLPLDPATKAKFLALTIKMRNLGIYGDEMAEILSPSQGDPQQALAQAQANLQQSQQAISEMQAEIQKLKLEKAGKVIDNEYEKQFQQMQNDMKVLIALIQAKNQERDQELEMYKTFWVENHGAAHEVGMAAMQQQHAKELAQQNAALNPPQPQEPNQPSA